MLRRLSIVALVLAMASPVSYATTFELHNEANTVVGNNIVLYSHYEDTLLDIARQFDLGYNDIVEANPDVDPWLPGENTRIIVPTRFILPATTQGIVINIAELRLYYFPKTATGDIQRVITHPIGIGREGWATPLGKTRITEKRKDPTWTPPESIRQEHLANGDPLPRVVAAGPDNPLGEYAMRLSMPSYLLHGTNKPFGVGLRVSHGCIRLYPEDIEALFGMTPSNTPVEIIYQPEKAGIRNQVLYVESHEPHEDIDKREGSNMTPMVSAILDSHNQLPTDEGWEFVETAVQEKSGVVVSSAEPDLGIVNDLWFVHGGLSRQAINKIQQTLTTLNMTDRFWPIHNAAVGENLIGPFKNQEEADAMAQKLSDAAGMRVWTVQMPADAL